MSRLRSALRYLYLRSSWTHGPLGTRLWEHAQYAGFATGVALVVGVIVGLALGRRGRPTVRMLWGLTRSVPVIVVVVLLGSLGSLPVWGLLIGLGLAVAPTIAGATATGARSVPVAAVVAAHGLGFGRRERWRAVVLPLTYPHTLAGLRAAVVQVVALVAVAGFAGHLGGLGQMLADGRAAGSRDPRTLAAVLLTLTLALATSGAIALLRRFTSSAGVRRGR
jgi:osmoprotectant transport system permease protein